MSAIWGVVDLSGGEIKGMSGDMTRCLDKYKIDRVSQVEDGNVYMGCGIQYITRQARSEKLPYHEESDFFTADCYLDNRKDLICELRKAYTDLDITEDTPDGELLYLAFKKWKEKFGDHVLGAFSFAFYNRDSGEFYLFTDHISSRSIFYYLQDNRIFFGTLTGSITDACKEIEVSDKWMSACMSVDFPVMLLFEGLSPYENVYILPYGMGIKASMSGKRTFVEKIRYYDPLTEVKEDKSITDEQAKELFLDTFKKSVEGTLRTDGDVGVLLSSGLDSSAVASMAAGLLKNDGNRVLRSYTSVPLKDFDKTYENNGNYWIDDESEGVKILCEKYDNIKPSFLDCQGKSVLTNIEKFVDYMEFPGKALINHVWMFEAQEKARADGCRVVLFGGHGNFTVSYGSIMSSAFFALKEGKILTAIDQVCKIAKKEHISRKKLLKQFFKRAFLREKVDVDELFLDEAYRKELLEKFGVRKAMEDLLSKEGDGMVTRSQYRKSVVSTLLLQLMGMYETKDGLYSGILVRDPTRDKRILELCLRLPYRCFAWDGLERRLVRKYMEDYIPDEIRLISRRRGRQSGDSLLRYQKYGLADGKEPWEVLDKDIERYFDYDRAVEELKEKTTEENIRRKVKILACSVFMKNNKKIIESLV